MDTWSYSSILLKSLLLLAMARMQLLSAIQPSDFFPFGVSGQNSGLGSGSGSGSASGDLCILEGDSCDLNADFHATNCTCMCKSGYDGDGLYCININECDLEPAICGPNAVCVDTFGSYQCIVCSSGYSSNGTDCININECLEGTHTCDDNADCNDVIGTFDCTCTPGYSGDGVSNCTDVNECESGEHDCDTNAECMNTEGNYGCACRKGYAGNGTVCINVDECLEETHNCTENADCTDTVGSFLCMCVSGFSGDGYNNCTDIDECVDNNSLCDLNAFCTNTLGNYTCTCRFGYSGDGNVCVALPVPDAPDAIHIITVTATTAAVSWVAPPIDPNNLVAFYNLTLREKQFGLPDINATVTTTTYMFTLLEEYTEYECSIVSVGVFGTYSIPVSVNFSTLEAAPSGAPLSAHGVAISPTTIEIIWLPPLAVDINGDIEFYIVEVREITVTGQLMTFHAVEDHIFVAPVHPGYDYQCRVAAFTISNGPFTDSFIVNPQELAPSSPPLNFMAMSADSRSIILYWDPPPVEDRNGRLLGYLINVTVLEIGMAFQLNTTMEMFQLFQLIPYTTYKFTIAAFTHVGLGPFTEMITEQTPEDVPSQPVSVTVSTIYGSPNSLQVIWTPPNEPNGVITYYTVYCIDVESDALTNPRSGVPLLSLNISESSTLLSLVVTSNETQIEFTGLVPHTVYSCYVSANTSVGEGNFSEAIEAETDEAIPGDAPGNFHVAVLTARTCLLQWFLLLIPNGVLISHTIIYNLTSNEEINVTTDGLTTSYLITGLHPHEYYQFTVFASTRIGDGPTSSLIVQTNEASPAAPPLNIMSVVNSPRSASISWLPPLPENRNGILRYYILQLVDEQLGYDDVIINTTLTSHTFSNLEEYNLYSYSIAAATSAGVGVFSDQNQFTTQEDVPTAPPENITSIVDSATQITFDWSPPSPREINGVLRIYIAELLERYTGRDWVLFAVNTGVSINSLHPYYLYDFKVNAYTIGQGPYSDVITVLTDEDIPTAPPQDIAVDQLSSTRMTLTWNPPPFEHINGLIRYYTMQVTEMETQATFTVTSNTTEVTVEGLHPYYTYQCKIAAHTIDLGPFSNAITIQLLEEIPIASPTNVSGIAIDSETIILTWNPPPFDQQNGLIRHYTINITELDTGYEFLQTATGTEFILYSLHPYYTYVFEISAVTVGEGPSSEPIAVQADQDVPSGPVVNPVAQTSSSTSIILEWEPPILGEQNGIITGYVVNIAVESGNVNFQFNITSLSLLVEGLTPFTTYSCRIAARTIVGIGPYSPAITALTLQDAPSSPPLNVSAVSVSSMSIVLFWFPPPSNEQNGIIVYYQVNITEVETGNDISLLSPDTLITVPHLHPFYTYVCIVSAVTVTEGPYSDELIITTPQDVPSGYPQNFQASAATSRSAVLMWDPPAADEQNGLITEYILNVTEADSGETIQLFSPTTMLAVDILQPFTTYYLIIAASTIVGRGPFSTIVTLQMPEDVPENPPSNPTGVTIDSETVHLSWDAPLGDHNGRIREYTVNVTELETGREFQLIATTTFIEITSLHPFYTYEWQVSAVTIDKGPYTTLSVVMTSEDVPSSPPENIYGEALSSTSIFITWDPPVRQHRNGIITGYFINITTLATREVVQVFTLDNNYTVNFLQPFTVHDLIVAASTTAGIGPFSTVLTIQTLEDAPTSKPSNSTGIALNSTHIFLTWDPPPTEHVNGVIREYQINTTELETGIVSQYTTDSSIQELVIGPLHPYYTYLSTIVAFTVDIGPYTTVITVRTEEDAPSGPPLNFVATVNDPRVITLSWDPPSPDQQNGILRSYLISLESEEDTHTQNVSAFHRSVRINGLRPYTEYNCTVRAVTIETGPSSGPILRTTFEDAPSGAPQFVAAELVDPYTFVVIWQPPPAEDRNGIIRNYVVNLTELETGTAEQYIISSELNITIPSRHPFYRYRYSVAAETISLGPYSDPQVVHLPEAAPSAAPMGVIATLVTSTSFLLSWANPPPVNHNGIIRNYTVVIIELNTGTMVQYVSQTTSWTLDSLHPDYNYSVAVAVVTVAEGPLSPVLIVSTLEDVPSGPPQNLMLSAETSRSIKITWDPPLVQNRNGIIVNYTIFITVDDSTTMEIMTTATAAIITDQIRPFTVYICSVAASTRVGHGPQTAPLSITTPEDAPLAPPTSLIVTNVTSTSVSLSWEPPQMNLHNGVIRHYLIMVSETNTGTNSSHRTTANTAFTIRMLHPYYTYVFMIQAVTVAAGPFSSSITAVTHQDVPSGVPVGIQATPHDSRTLTLEWSPPLEESQNGIITHYSLGVSVSESGQGFDMIIDGETAVTLQDLHPYYEYNYNIAAATSVGTGPFSERNSIRMPQDVPSSPPQSIEGQTVNSRQIFLSWDNPEFGGRNGIIIGYSINVLEIITNTEFAYNVINRTTVLVEQLHPHYEYQCSVAAATIVGMGPYSAPIVVKTDEDVPSESPEVISSAAIDSTTIEMVWTEPPIDTHNGIILSYNIILTVANTIAMDTFSVNATSTSVNITDLHPFYVYSLRVAGMTRYGAGPYSDDVSVTTLEDVPSGAPQNVVGTSSSTSVSISWEPPRLELQNGIIRSYNVTVLELETDQLESFVIVASEFHLTLRSRHPFYRYNCSVYAYTIGLGPAAHLIIQTQEEAPSEVPGNVQAKVINSSSVQLSWEHPPPEAWNGIITGYIVRVMGLHTDDNYELSLTNDTKAVLGGLHPYYAYRFSIAAVTVDVGPFWTTMNLMLSAGAPKGSVIDVTVSVLSPSSVNVSWLPTSKDNWNGPIQQYIVEYQLLRSADNESAVESSGMGPFFTGSISIPNNKQGLMNNPDPTQATLPLNHESVVVQDLQEHHIYQFTVYYENIKGISEPSIAVTQETSVSAPSGPPLNIRVVPVSESVINITWDPPLLFERNGIITGYQINVTRVENNERRVHMVSVSDSITLSVQVRDLDAYTEYYVAMSASTQVGFGPYSSSILVRTFESTPEPPIIINVEIKNSTSVEVTWQEPVNTNGIIQGYQVSYFGYEGMLPENNTKQEMYKVIDELKVLTVKSNITAITVGDLIPGISYLFIVRARTGVGYGANSTEIIKLPGEHIIETEKPLGAAATSSIIVCITVVLLIVIIIGSFIYAKSKAGRVFLRHKRNNTQTLAESNFVLQNKVVDEKELSEKELEACYDTHEPELVASDSAM